MKKNVIIGLVFVLLIISVTLIIVLLPGHYYYVIFKDAEKLNNGDKVYMKGLVIGEVDEIQLNKDGKIKVKIIIHGDYKKTLSENVAFLIRKDNFIMGRKCIEGADLKGKSIAKKGHEYDGYNYYMTWKAAILKSKL